MHPLVELKHLFSTDLAAKFPSIYTHFPDVLQVQTNDILITTKKERKLVADRFNIIDGLFVRKNIYETKNEFESIADLNDLKYEILVNYFSNKENLSNDKILYETMRVELFNSVKKLVSSYKEKLDCCMKTAMYICISIFKLLKVF